MKQKLFKTMLLLCALIVGSGTMWGQSDKSTDYSGNVTLSTTGGINASACKVIIGGTEYDGIKAGTSKNVGAVQITVPSGTKYLHLHVAAWNGETVTLAVTPDSYSDDIALTANTGIASNSPFTFSGDPSTSDYYKVITFDTALETDTNLTFTATGGKRFVVWGVTSEVDGGGGTPTTYTVTYNANGGSGTMTDTNSPYASGATVTVLDNTFTREGYTFSKWNTAANGSGTDYDEGDTFTINANTTLYAQWTANGGGTGGNTVTLTQSNLELTGSYTSNTEKTIDGITYVYTDLMKSTDNIQAKASTGTIKNTTPYPGDITSVVIIHSGTARETTIYGSADGTNWTQVATGSGSINADFSNKGYKYFKITRGSNAAYWTKIEITYSSAKEETFSYVDYQGWANSPDYGKEITMSKTDVDITNNWFYTPQGDYHYIQFTATNGTGTITITPKNDATITRVEFRVFADYNGYQNDQTITPSIGTVSKNTEGTVITWEGEASAAFTLGYKSHIRWTSIIVTYTGGLPTCATPVISGETTFLTYSTVSIICATEGASIYYSTSTDGVNYTDYESYSEPFQISTTTQVRAYATKDGLANSKVVYQAFSQQGTVPNIRTFASTGAASQYLELHDALVTYKNGNTAYMEDAYGAIMLYNCVGDDLEAGDKLNGYMHVTGFIPSYNGLPEITDYELVEGYTKTSGNTVKPTVMTLEQLLGDPGASPYDMYLSKYIKIENATVTSAFTSKNCEIEQGGYTIVLRDQNKDATLTSTVDDVVTVTGHVSIYNTTNQIAVYEQGQIEVSISSDPTIIATATTLTGFTYSQGYGPSEVQSFTLSGFNLTDDITLSVIGDYEASTTEDSGFGSSIVFSKDATNQTVYVRLKAGLAENASYEGTITLASEGATNKTITLAGSVTAPEPAHFVWDLSTDQTTTATTDEMTWVNAIATMAVTKSNSSTPVNNYYPGTEGQNYTSTRFYTRSVLRITPAAGYSITSVVFTATTDNYANVLKSSQWTNATATAQTESEPFTVTVTPTDGTEAFYAAIGGTCGFTSVKVYYETVAPVPSITVDPATVDATAAETVGTLAITYANLTISDMDDFDIQYYNAEGEELSEGPDWILVEVAEDNGDYVVSYVIEKNVGAARTAYFKVYALDDETNLVYSNLVTVTQAAPAVDYATLPFDFDGGRADIESTNGLTQTGLGTDYSANDTKLKFDGSGDYVILKLQGGTAASLSFKTKGNTFSGGTFTVQTSTDGETYTNLAVFNENNIDGNYTCFISSSIKYIKWIYTEKVNGNVGLGSISVVALSFSVTLNGSGYATYCSPDGLDFTGVTEYSAWQITGANSSTGEITFSQVTGSVKGGTGLLLKGDAGETITLTSSNSENELSGNKLYGTLAPTYIEADQYYGLSGNKFVKVGAGTVPAGKALLPASVVGSSIKAFNFVFEDDPDGINSIDNGELTIDNAAIYNLAGQRLSKMQKGINIVNGKKILY